MAPMATAPPTYVGPKALGFSKYASPPQRKAQLATALSFPAFPSSASETTIATKQQIAAIVPTPEVKPLAAELAIEQGTALEKDVQDHTAKFSRAVSDAVTNTRKLLGLLRESTPGSEVLDDLWQELEQLFEAATDAKAALPDFLEKQRDNMSLYHSSMMNETIRETQEELQFQHKKVKTQHNLILEQQDAFQNYKSHTASKLDELQCLHERVSRLTLEKGNFRTEVDKYKELLDQEIARESQDLAIADALQKELETLVTSKKQLQAENETLRKTTTDILDQLKHTEQRVTERFSKELAAKAEELQKESAKAISLNTLVSTLKSGESATKKELDKVKNENRLLNVKYSDQASEHATAFTKMNEQAKKIETLTADVDRFRKQEIDLRSKAEDATELAKINKELSEAKEEMMKQMDSLTFQVNEARENGKILQREVEQLEIKLATKGIVPSASNDEMLLEQMKALEAKRDDLEVRLADWTELAKRSYKEYKETLLRLQESDKYRQIAVDKDMQIADLGKQLASAKAAHPNGVGVTAGGDTAYWKRKYETLLSSL